MNKIYYFNFNNYTNRTVKGYETLTEYIQNADYIGSSNTVNFNKTNDLEATITCYLDNYSSPDYALICDDNDKIISRWFVLGETRNNKNNYQLNLKRDIVYDNLELILNNEMTLIERGFCKDTSDAILNKESAFSFNEYKRKEIVLGNDYFKQKTGWLAIFFANKEDAQIPVLDDDVSGAIFCSDENTTYSGNTYEVNLSKTSAQSVTYSNNKGYSIALLPLVCLSKIDTYGSYKLVTANGNSAITNVNVTNSDSKTFNCDMRLSVKNTLLTFMKNIITNTETFIDIQVIPEVIGYDYAIDDSNQTITINRTSNMSYYNQICLYYGIEGGSGSFALLPIQTIVESSYDKEINLSDIVPNYDENASKKLLEPYKLYLESPDRSSSCEIDIRRFIRKNNGTINLNKIKFKVTYSYQPFQSYLYIYPQASGSYYQMNIQDGQFLLCGYNNQLLRTSDAWISFLLNNKNYLNSFNLEMRDAKINAVSGALASGISGAGSGALIGTALGGPVGTAIGAGVGAVVGAGASTVQSIININEKKQTFEWNCDNIQSKPQSVSKVSTFTPMNVIFPVLSVYYNDETTSGLFDKYLKMNGFAINKIGKIKDYYNETYQYVACELIRLDDFKGTGSELAEIQNELSRGLFFEA